MLDAEPTLVNSRVALSGVPPYTFTTYPAALDRHVSRTIATLGCWEPFETEIARRLLPLYSAFLDIGANIGWYSALAARLMPAGSSIDAFEPDPTNFAMLRRNVPRGEHLRVNLVAKALSDRSGTARLFHSADNFGDHRLYASATEPRPSEAVTTTTLDEHLGDRVMPPFLLKIDTQGSEPPILRGASRLLRDWPGDSAMLVEFWPYGMEAGGEDTRAYIDMLARLRLTPFVLVQEVSKLVRTDWETMRGRLSGDLAVAGGAFVDLLLLRPGGAAERAIADLEVVPGRPAGSAPRPGAVGG